ncbi:MAG TPA: DNA primase [Verrucomicrobiae bacterium]|nr:DNA primase [Verrucomicrobiae bacterium]
MPGLISEPVLEQIRQNNDVVEVIGSYFPLKHAGANFRALCPFHKEKTPSFNVNPQKQIWHCFGCGAGGDVFTFVMKYESLDFIGAVRRLAERAGIKLEYEERAGEPERNQKDSLLKLHELAANFFHHNLMKEPSAAVAREYLKKRRITSETAKKWRLGYSPDSWDGLIRYAAAKKFFAELLGAAGLALQRESGDGFYDRFRGRLMFPIGDEQGRTVGFSGRILTDEKDQPKYVNSPETAIFQKGRILFALDKAKRAIIDEKYAIVCEGQVDTISCHEAGVENVVAPQGTALTEHHARILKRYAEEVVLIFDADTAGQNAIVRSADPLWDAGVVIRVAVLPKGHDPDSFVKAFGAEKLKALVIQAPSFFAYLLDRLCQQHDPHSERGKLQIGRQMAEWLARIPTPILLATYAQQTAKRLDIGEEALRKEAAKLAGGRRGRRTMTEDDADTNVAEDIDTVRPAGLPAEVMLLQTMLADERQLEMTADRLDLAWLSSSVAAQVIQDVLRLYRSNEWNGPKSLLNGPQGEETSNLVSKLLLNTQPAKRPEAVTADCLATLERQWLEHQVRDVRKELSKPGVSPAVVATLQKQWLDLDSKLRHIAAFLMGKQ